jgi:hypothetical protein
MQKHKDIRSYANYSMPVEIENMFFNTTGEIRARRRLYRAYLTDLTPGTDYSFVIYYNTTDYMTLRYKFRTPH